MRWRIPLQSWLLAIEILLRFLLLYFAGENDAKMMDSRSEMNCKSMESKEDHNIDRIKRAAVTALSAAAVKAKLLADQEEEQIRELVALLIEKQV